MIGILIISKSKELIETIESGIRILPDSLLKSKNKNASLCSLHLKNSDEINIFEEIKNELGDFYSDLEGLILLSDRSIAMKLKAQNKSSLIINELGDYSSFFSQVHILREYLESKIVSVLKSYFWIADITNEGFSDLLKLPEKNFKSRELEYIYNELSNISSENYRDVKECLISLKRKIRIPKKRPHSAKVFFVDERYYYFEAGKENHSAHETSYANGHSILCDISAKFRFGVRINEKKHFNMTIGDEYESSAYGNFDGCHCQNQKLKKTTHANIFTNDYISNL